MLRFVGTGSSYDLVCTKQVVSGTTAAASDVAIPLSQKFRVTPRHAARRAEPYCGPVRGQKGATSPRAQRRPQTVGQAARAGKRSAKGDRNPPLGPSGSGALMIVDANPQHLWVCVPDHETASTEPRLLAGGALARARARALVSQDPRRSRPRNGHAASSTGQPARHDAASGRSRSSRQRPGRGLGSKQVSREGWSARHNRLRTGAPDDHREHLRRYLTGDDHGSRHQSSFRARSAKLALADGRAAPCRSRPS
jgi:hypothetical protein